MTQFQLEYCAISLMWLVAMHFLTAVSTVNSQTPRLTTTESDTVVIDAADEDFNSTTTEIPEMYQTLCTHPKQASVEDVLYAFKSISSKVKRYIQLSNPAARLHFAEIIKGHEMFETDDFSRMCTRSYTEYKDKGEVDILVTGFGDMLEKWKCFGRQDDPGVLFCKYYNPITKYSDGSRFYISWTDRNHLIVTVWCFPNGDNGWIAASSNPVLEPAEKIAILKHVSDVGFDISDENVVSLYNATLCV